ncbi:Uncharacterized protein APZ42_011375 [Daphnia magna]|uniref:Uncharacterized protein n=1 Tax=Daphnia magna TaxID=35525 RepID=A0A162SLJ8_9CRUS|nr:Uncharacterized protein APZ42_011375 [Daphnia magna]
MWKSMTLTSLTRELSAISFMSRKIIIFLSCLVLVKNVGILHHLSAFFPARLGGNGLSLFSLSSP